MTQENNISGWSLRHIRSGPISNTRKWHKSALWVSSIHHGIIRNSVEALKIKLCDKTYKICLWISQYNSYRESCLWHARSCSDFPQYKCSVLSEHFIGRCTRPSSVCQPSWNRSACWSEKKRTVYWPQFCGSVVSNFTARFLSALTITDGTAVREQGHLAAEPQSAPRSWQAWWMQADEYTLCLYYSPEPRSVGLNQQRSAVMYCRCAWIRAFKWLYIILVVPTINNI